MILDVGFRHWNLDMIYDYGRTSLGCDPDVQVVSSLSWSLNVDLLRFLKWSILFRTRE